MLRKPPAWWAVCLLSHTPRDETRAKSTGADRPATTRWVLLCTLPTPVSSWCCSVQCRAFGTKVLPGMTATQSPGLISLRGSHLPPGTTSLVDKLQAAGKQSACMAPM